MLLVVSARGFFFLVGSAFGRGNEHFGVRVGSLTEHGPMAEDLTGCRACASILNQTRMGASSTGGAAWRRAGCFALPSARSRASATGSLRLRAPIRNGRNAATAHVHLGLRAFGRHLTLLHLAFRGRRVSGSGKSGWLAQGCVLRSTVRGPQSALAAAFGRSHASSLASERGC